MKFALSCLQNLALVVLALNVTSILAFSWNNITGLSLTALEGDFGKVKSWFEGQVASEVANVLKDVGGVIGTVSMGLGDTPPIRGSLKTSGVHSELVLGLYDGSGDYPQPKQFDFAKDRYQNWTKGWFGVALEQFDAVVELDIDLSAAANTGDLTLSLLKESASYGGVGVEVEFQLYLTADAAASMSFTTGLNLSLANPSAIMMPALDNSILDLKGSKNIGFSPDDFIITPIFNASLPQLEFSATLSLRTIFSVIVEDIAVGALTLDLPAFDLGVTTLHNKMANCKTPPPGTPPDHIYAELIQLSATVDATLGYELLDGTESGQIGSWTMANLLDECYAFLPGSGSLGHVPASSKDPVLTAAAVETCTTEGKTTTISTALKTLSTGDKAAIIVGSVIGVFLIAALAWYGGRASQRHSNKKHGIDGGEKCPPQTYYHSVDPAHCRHESNVPLFASSTLAQPTDSGTWTSVPNADGDSPTEERRQSWIKRKPVPRAAKFEPDTTPSASTSLTEDYDVSRAWLREAGSP